MLQAIMVIHSLMPVIRIITSIVDVEQVVFQL